MRAFEQVLKCYCRRFLAIAFLDNRTIRAAGLCWRLTPCLGYSLDQKGMAVRHPLQCRSYDCVDLDASNLMGAGRSGIADPKLNPVRCRVGESKMPAVG